MDTSRLNEVKASLRNGTPRSHVLVLHLGRQTRLKPSLDVLLPRAFVDGQPSHTTFPSIITEIGVGQSSLVRELGAGHGGCLGAAPSGAALFRALPCACGCTDVRTASRVPSTALRVVAAGARRDCRSALKAAAFAAPYDASCAQIRGRRLTGVLYLMYRWPVRVDQQQCTVGLARGVRDLTSTPAVDASCTPSTRQVKQQ